MEGEPPSIPRAKKPKSRVRRVLETLGILATIAGGFAALPPLVQFVQESRPPIHVVSVSDGQIARSQTCGVFPVDPTDESEIPAPEELYDFVLSNSSSSPVQVVGFIPVGGSMLNGPRIDQLDAAASGGRQLVYWQKLAEGAKPLSGPFTIEPGAMVAVRVAGRVDIPPRMILGDGSELTPTEKRLTSSAAIPNVERIFEAFPSPCGES